MIKYSLELKRLISETKEQLSKYESALEIILQLEQKKSKLKKSAKSKVVLLDDTAIVQENPHKVIENIMTEVELARVRPKKAITAIDWTYRIIEILQDTNVTTKNLYNEYAQSYPEIDIKHVHSQVSSSLHRLEHWDKHRRIERYSLVEGQKAIYWRIKH